MIYVGIDVASESHSCCILSNDGNVLREFSFTNNALGFALLLGELSDCSAPEDAHIGLEATGIYGENLVAFLRRNGFKLSILNPLSVKKRLAATTLRKTKTDKSDARFLALLMKQQIPQPDTAPLYRISELKSLSRARFHTVQRRSASKTRIKGLLTMLFPELLHEFSDIFGVSGMALLRHYPTVRSLAMCHTSSLTALLQESSRGRFGADKAEHLRSLAKASVGTVSDALSLQLQMELDMLSLLDAQVKRYELAIREIMDELDSPITSIPGIGYVLGALILSEIGDIQSFSSPAKLLAFAGLDPSIYQSGKFTPSSGSMVKRGSPYLRWALTYAAGLVSRSCPTFIRYMDKKLSEGKHYSVAKSHVAKKLVRLIFSLLSRNSSFDLAFSA